MQPHELVSRVDALVRRLTLRARLTSWSWTLAAVLGVTLLFVLLDCAIRSPDRGLRWLASMAFAAAIGGLVYLVWVRYRTASPDRLAVAQQLQNRYPQFGSRLASGAGVCGAERNRSHGGFRGTATSGGDQHGRGGGAD